MTDEDRTMLYRRTAELLDGIYWISITFRLADWGVDAIDGMLKSIDNSIACWRYTGVKHETISEICHIQKEIKAAAGVMWVRLHYELMMKNGLKYPLNFDYSRN